MKNNHEQMEVLGITLMASNDCWMNKFDTVEVIVLQSSFCYSEAESACVTTLSTTSVCHT